ncbi:hypothetical protein MBLNU13_g09299t1 [Cladosporium sp. NU13]
MSTFGAPGTGVKIGRPNPPAKGSFPLDHDAECQPLMKQYLRCLKTARGVNSPECRELSKNYLSCRMERGLMAPDEMKNLGCQPETITTCRGMQLQPQLEDSNIGLDRVCTLAGPHRGSKGNFTARPIQQ